MKRSIYAILFAICAISVSCNKVAHEDDVVKGKPLSFKLSMAKVNSTRGVISEPVKRVAVENGSNAYFTIETTQRTADRNVLTKGDFDADNPLPDYVDEVGVTVAKYCYDFANSITCHIEYVLENVSAHRQQDDLLTWQTDEPAYYPEDAFQFMTFVYYPRLELNTGYSQGGMRLVSWSDGDAMDPDFRLVYLYSIPGAREGNVIHLTDNDLIDQIDPIAGMDWDDQSEPIEIYMRHCYSKVNVMLDGLENIGACTVKKVIFHNVVTDVDLEDCNSSDYYFYFSDDKPRNDVSYETEINVSGNETEPVQILSMLMIPQSGATLEVVIEKDGEEVSYMTSSYQKDPDSMEDPDQAYLYFNSNCEHNYTLHF